MFARLFNSIDFLFDRYSLRLLNLISALIIIAVSLGVVAKFELISMPDLPQYLAGSELLGDALTPYNAELQKLYQQKIAKNLDYNGSNLYIPPIALPVLFPLANLSFEIARISYVIAFLLITFLTVYLIAPGRYFWLASAISLLSASSFTCLQNGQISIFIYLAFALHVFFWAKNSSLASGFFLTFTLFKPQLFLLYYLFLAVKIIQRKDSRLVIGSLTTFFTLALIITLCRPVIWSEYLSFVSDANLISTWQTSSLYTLLILQDASFLAPVVTIAGLFLIVIMVFNQQIRSLTSTQQLLLASSVSLAFSNYYWLADSIILFVAVLFSLRYSSALLLIYLMMIVVDYLCLALGVTYQGLYWRVPLLTFFIFAFYSSLPKLSKLN